MPAIRRLRPGDGVLFRHYELAPAARLALARQVAALCRRQGLLLLVAGDVRLARAVGADGLHLPEALLGRAVAARRAGLALITAAAHSAAAVVRAGRGGQVDAVLVSPVFATASHPGAAGLGIVHFAALATAAQRQGLRVYALGGMSAAALRRLRGLPVTGFAALGSLA